MKEILYILIAFAIFMSLVYAYAIYATKNGMSNDENNNFIPDSWERIFKWVFQAKVFIYVRTWVCNWVSDLQNLFCNLSLNFSTSSSTP